MNEASDIDFPVPEAPPPDPATLARVRKEMEAIVDEALPGIPRVRPERNWDSTQKRILRIAYRRAALDFDRTVDLMEAIQELCSSATAKATYKRWDYDSGRVKEIQARIDALIEVTPERPDPPARKLVSAWQAHRYGPVMELVRGAAQAFAHHRRRTGQLTFHDLLVLARDLLSGSPSARRSLGERWRYLLVDEFQDTDPLQAELLFLLASEPDDDGGAERAWAQLTPRPGALFVVGDPKQSIYRFRRADIALYGRVRERFAEFGAVVALTTNFRSTPPIEAIVDGVFAPDATTAPGLFPGEATDVQAGYAPLDTRPAGPGKPEGGVYRYTLPADVGRRDELVDVDAQSLATWIAGRLAQGRKPEDFLVLTRTRRGLDRYARALEAHAIPVAVSGSGVGIETELSELRLLMTALTDPGDPVGVLAALEGLFFGVDLDQLLQHREAGGTLDFRRPNQPPGPVTDALALLQEWWQLARQRPADEVVERDASGQSAGYCAVTEQRSRWSWVTLAAAPGWDARSEREDAFERAEQDRLLYVAVTRAEEELVVGMKAPGGRERGPWAPLEAWLLQEATELKWRAEPPPPRRELEHDEALTRREREVAERRCAAGEAAWDFETVTSRTHREERERTEAADLFHTAGIDIDDATDAGAAGWSQSLADGTGPGGYTWGNAVHATLEAAAGGLDGAALAGVARTALLENDRPVTSGEPVELDALLELVDRLQQSDLWARARNADVLLTEQSFVLEQEDGSFLEGVIDLAFREDDGWVIVDYKTAADDRVFALRLPRYRRQVELYAEAWSRITGEAVREARV
ncbi:MAG: UvrD-helicase domain-containing protein, partial [Gemmatimonadetes bacterium]|nr:UvrD-helicase domain-containing protein [Gemmatimonadota bacterium]